MADYAKMSEEELLKELSAKRDALRTFRFSEAGSRTRNVKEGRAIRKEIARILTELSARRKNAAGIVSSPKSA